MNSQSQFSLFQKLKKMKMSSAEVFIQKAKRQQKIFSRAQGPFVQSVVSLTSSLRVISLTVLADSIYNILIFFAKKM